MFSGLRAEHTQQDFVRAVVEGVTFGLNYALRALDRAGVRATEITLVGNGASSDAWAQLCADVFGRPLVRPQQTEAAALGGTRQARWAVDGTPVSSQAAGGRRFDPNPSDQLEEAAHRADALCDIALANGL